LACTVPPTAAVRGRVPLECCFCTGSRVAPKEVDKLSFDFVSKVWRRRVLQCQRKNTHRDIPNYTLSLYLFVYVETCIRKHPPSHTLACNASICFRHMRGFKVRFSSDWLCIRSSSINTETSLHCEPTSTHRPSPSQSKSVAQVFVADTFGGPFPFGIGVVSQVASIPGRCACNLLRL
jgi:hypothetical protein